MRRRSTLRAVLAALATLLAAVLVACGGTDDPGADADDAPPAAAASGTRTVERTRVEVVEGGAATAGIRGFDPRRIFRRDGPGVVTIVSVFEDGADSAIGGEGPQGGVGSGFVVNRRGEVVTNAHVVTTGEGAAIRRADEVFVKFADDNQVPAEIVGFDPNADVALLRLETLDGLTLRPLELGRSADVGVGEPVVAIGSPFGEEQSLSAGVVSATDRAIDALTGFQTLGAVQTDAAINQGNSGGPLIDARGAVIGINAQIRTNSGGGEGVGYAIPIDQVRRSVDQIRATGEASYAYLGVSTTAIYPQLNDRFDLGTDEGAWVQEVVADGPADDAGLQAGDGQERFQAREFGLGGDIITGVEGTPIRTDNDLGLSLTRFGPGETVTLEIVRDGERRPLEIELGERPAQAEAG